MEKLSAKHKQFAKRNRPREAPSRNSRAFTLDFQICCTSKPSSSIDAQQAPYTSHLMVALKCDGFHYLLKLFLAGLVILAFTRMRRPTPQGPHLCLILIFALMTESTRLQANSRVISRSTRSRARRLARTQWANACST